MNTIVLVGPQGQLVCELCELADGFLNRGRGLLGRSELPSGQGMLIRPTWSVHTGFMRFAIDVVFLDEEPDGPQDRAEAPAVARGVPPGRPPGARASRRESVSGSGSEVGDRLAWGSLEPEA